MKWALRDHVHLDRVAAPWLIKRFVDKDAAFVFVPWGEEDKAPADSIPLAMPWGDLTGHDAEGTTFRKVIRKYKLDDPGLEALEEIIQRGVDYVLHGYRPAVEDAPGQMAVGLLAIAEGLMLTHHKDADILAASFPVYDALYANLTVHRIIKDRGLTLPDHEGKGPTNLTRFMRELLQAKAGQESVAG